ncbi:hypothetical protein KPL78_13525 [Roseomonas sp. HJA6]|uniref:Uncharacterized protein n=1 Tax=Roseomonas alba TaxID=2846776 RepID=A0ABS7A9D1_9PROT|nr:hypothetical protein [Neoroseomonas alba]MBW6398879.1 hypothetical protein [Neoroseomonas alba]
MTIGHALFAMVFWLSGLPRGYAAQPFRPGQQMGKASIRLSEDFMQGRGVAAAVEKAIRDQLALTDQPRAALMLLAEELYTALARVADAGPPGALDHVRREFREAIAKIWREYGNDEPLPPIRILPVHALGTGIDRHSGGEAQPPAST